MHVLDVALGYLLIGKVYGCEFVCPYVCWYVWTFVYVSVHLYVHWYICVSDDMFMCLSLQLYIHQYINTYLKAIVSFLPCQFSQMLTLNDWVSWFTG